MYVFKKGDCVDYGAEASSGCQVSAVYIVNTKPKAVFFLLSMLNDATICD